MTRCSAAITAIDYFLPAKTLTNEDLAMEFPEWGAERIAEKTGIKTRHIAAPDELSSDLAAAAAQKLFASGKVKPQQIDFVLFCTQTPDFGLPTSACLLQHRLGIPSSAGALDFNLGCSGYIYGLSLAKGLIETGQAKCVLFLTAETYSKLLDPADKSVRTIFGDAGAATVIEATVPTETEKIGPFVFGTDGSGGPNLICAQGGFRSPSSCQPHQWEDQRKSSAEASAPYHLWMNGPEMFNFTLRVVPAVVAQTLEKAALTQDQVDLFVFHQANQYMLEHIRRKLSVPPEKFVLELAHCGNTISSSIPIALTEARRAGRTTASTKILLVGFGVGYSWGAAMVFLPE